MLALVGAATMLCTPLAGRLVDRRGPDPVNLVCTLGVLVSAAVLTAGARGGALGLTALILGTLLLDVAMQSGMVDDYLGFSRSNNVFSQVLPSRTRP
ncbi:MAG: hypothetical protein QOE54_4992 [Streptosporangiaceae bacterium]|jgi:predicted MFS family arabinose efflux permease|nr:major facilitator superfamily 1 [Streptosporangiaceae bacterium]MDX6432626.1 hypothetical protein [Streptosporangiaceae bacterium]